MGWYLRLYIAVYAANNNNNNLALKFCTTTVIHNGSKGSWDLESVNWQDFSSSKYIILLMFKCLKHYARPER